LQLRRIFLEHGKKSNIAQHCFPCGKDFYLYFIVTDARKLLTLNIRLAVFHLTGLFLSRGMPAVAIFYSIFREPVLTASDAAGKGREEQCE